MIPLASDLLPFPATDAAGRPFGVRQSPNRLFFIGPHWDCGPHSSEVSRGGSGRGG